MSKEILKSCRKLDRSLDDMRKVLDIYTQLYPNVKDTIDEHFDDLFTKAHDVILKHEIGACQASECTDIWHHDDLDHNGYCENCRED